MTTEIIQFEDGQIYERNEELSKQLYFTRPRVLV